ncbi:unnamed protein product [Prunus armeniaca]
MDIGSARHSAHCHCGKMVVMVTSWTDANPGRRFQVCPKSKKGKGHRGRQFWEWYDLEMCPRSKVVIRGLLMKIHKLEEENGKIRRSRILTGAVLVSFFFLLYVIKWN